MRDIPVDVRREEFALGEPKPISESPFGATERMILQIMDEDGLSRREAVLELVNEGQIHPDEAELYAEA
jgi:hypothetical protein